MRASLRNLPRFWRVVLAFAVLAVIGGVVFGFVRGLDHLRTLPFAVVEGGLLIGVPGTVLGIVVALLVEVVARDLRRPTPPPPPR